MVNPECSHARLDVEWTVVEKYDRTKKVGTKWTKRENLARPVYLNSSPSVLEKSTCLSLWCEEALLIQGRSAGKCHGDLPAS